MRAHKWGVVAILVVCFVIYWFPVLGTVLMYGMGEPGSLTGPGLLLMMWSFGEWFRTIWVFTRPRKNGEPPRR